MSRLRRLGCRLVAAIACCVPGAAARAEEPVEPMPENLRTTAEKLALRGEFRRLVRAHVYAPWVSLESMPPPLNRWRPDIGWKADPNGAVGLAPLPTRKEPPCSSLDGAETPPDLHGWPLFQALLAERCWRETQGAGSLPEGSPLAGLPDPDGTIARFLDLQRSVYRPIPREQDPDAAWAAAARASRERAGSLRASSHIWAALAAGLLLALTLLAGLRAKPRS